MAASDTPRNDLVIDESGRSYSDESPSVSGMDLYEELFSDEELYKQKLQLLENQVTALTLERTSLSDKLDHLENELSYTSMLLKKVYLAAKQGDQLAKQKLSAAEARMKRPFVFTCSNCQKRTELNPPIKRVGRVKFYPVKKSLEIQFENELDQSYFVRSHGLLENLDGLPTCPNELARFEACLAENPALSYFDDSPLVSYLKERGILKFFDDENANGGIVEVSKSEVDKVPMTEIDSLRLTAHRIFNDGHEIAVVDGSEQCSSGSDLVGSGTALELDVEERKSAVLAKAVREIIQTADGVRDGRLQICPAAETNRAAKRDCKAIFSEQPQNVFSSSSGAVGFNRVSEMQNQNMPLPKQSVIQHPRGGPARSATGQSLEENLQNTIDASQKSGNSEVVNGRTQTTTVLQYPKNVLDVAGSAEAAENDASMKLGPRTPESRPFVARTAKPWGLSKPDNNRRFGLPGNKNIDEKSQQVPPTEQKKHGKSPQSNDLGSRARKDFKKAERSKRIPGPRGQVSIISDRSPRDAERRHNIQESVREDSARSSKNNRNVDSPFQSKEVAFESLPRPDSPGPQFALPVPQAEAEKRRKATFYRDRSRSVSVARTITDKYDGYRRTNSYRRSQFGRYQRERQNRWRNIPREPSPAVRDGAESAKSRSPDRRRRDRQDRNNRGSRSYDKRPREEELSRSRDSARSWSRGGSRRRSRERRERERQRDPLSRYGRRRSSERDAFYRRSGRSPRSRSPVRSRDGSYGRYSPNRSDLERLVREAAVRSSDETLGYVDKRDRNGSDQQHGSDDPMKTVKQNDSRDIVEQSPPAHGTETTHDVLPEKETAVTPKMTPSSSSMDNSDWEEGEVRDSPAPEKRTKNLANEKSTEKLGHRVQCDGGNSQTRDGQSRGPAVERVLAKPERSGPGVSSTIAVSEQRRREKCRTGSNDDVRDSPKSPTPSPVTELLTSEKTGQALANLEPFGLKAAAVAKQYPNSRSKSANTPKSRRTTSESTRSGKSDHSTERGFVSESVTERNRLPCTVKSQSKVKAAREMKETAPKPKSKVSPEGKSRKNASGSGPEDIISPESTGHTGRPKFRAIKPKAPTPGSPKNERTDSGKSGNDEPNKHDGSDGPPVMKKMILRLVRVQSPMPSSAESLPPTPDKTRDIVRYAAHSSAESPALKDATAGRKKESTKIGAGSASDSEKTISPAALKLKQTLGDLQVDSKISPIKRLRIADAKTSSPDRAAKAKPRKIAGSDLNSANRLVRPLIAEAVKAIQTTEAEKDRGQGAQPKGKESKKAADLKEGEPSSQKAQSGNSGKRRSETNSNKAPGKGELSTKDLEEQKTPDSSHAKKSSKAGPSFLSEKRHKLLQKSSKKSTKPDQVQKLKTLETSAPNWSDVVSDNHEMDHDEPESFLESPEDYCPADTTDDGGSDFSGATQTLQQLGSGLDGIASLWNVLAKKAPENSCTKTLASVLARASAKRSPEKAKSLLCPADSSVPATERSEVASSETWEHSRLCRSVKLLCPQTELSDFKGYERAGPSRSKPVDPEILANRKSNMNQGAVNRDGSGPDRGFGSSGITDAGEVAEDGAGENPDASELSREVNGGSNFVDEGVRLAARLVLESEVTAYERTESGTEHDADTFSEIGNETDERTELSVNDGVQNLPVRKLPLRKSKAKKPNYSDDPFKGNELLDEGPAKSSAAKSPKKHSAMPGSEAVNAESNSTKPATKTSKNTLQPANPVQNATETANVNEIKKPTTNTKIASKVAAGRPLPQARPLPTAVAIRKKPSSRTNRPGPRSKKGLSGKSRKEGLKTATPQEKKTENPGNSRGEVKEKSEEIANMGPAKKSTRVRKPVQRFIEEIMDDVSLIAEDVQRKPAGKRRRIESASEASMQGTPVKSGLNKDSEGALEANDRSERGRTPIEDDEVASLRGAKPTRRLRVISESSEDASIQVEQKNAKAGAEDLAKARDETVGKDCQNADKSAGSEPESSGKDSALDSRDDLGLSEASRPPSSRSVSASGSEKSQDHVEEVPVMVSVDHFQKSSGANPDYTDNVSIKNPAITKAEDQVEKTESPESSEKSRKIRSRLQTIMATARKVPPIEEAISDAEGVEQDDLVVEVQLTGHTLASECVETEQQRYSDTASVERSESSAGVHDVSVNLEADIPAGGRDRDNFNSPNTSDRSVLYSDLALTPSPVSEVKSLTQERSELRSSVKKSLFREENPEENGQRGPASSPVPSCEKLVESGETGTGKPEITGSRKRPASDQLVNPAKTARLETSFNINLENGDTAVLDCSEFGFDAGSGSSDSDSEDDEPRYRWLSVNKITPGEASVGERAPTDATIERGAPAGASVDRGTPRNAGVDKGTPRDAGSSTDEKEVKRMRWIANLSKKK